MRVLGGGSVPLQSTAGARSSFPSDSSSSRSSATSMTPPSSAVSPSSTRTFTAWAGFSALMTRNSCEELILVDHHAPGGYCATFAGVSRARRSRPSRARRSRRGRTIVRGPPAQLAEQRTFTTTWIRPGRRTRRLTYRRGDAVNATSHGATAWRGRWPAQPTAVTVRREGDRVAARTRTTRPQRSRARPGYENRRGLAAAHRFPNGTPGSLGIRPNADRQ